MRKYFGLLLLTIILVPLSINAQSVEIENPLEHDSLWGLLAAVIDFIFYISIPLASLLIVVSGYFFLASAGDPEKVRQAKHIIIYTLIGLTVVFLSKAIIAMLAERFGIDVRF